MKLISTILFLCLFLASVQAAEFDLNGHGKLSLVLPSRWTVNGSPAVKPDGSAIGYALAIKPVNDAHAKCLLTFAYVDEGPPNRERIRSRVLAATKQFVTQSKEKKATLRDFALEKGYGAYCVLTDAATRKSATADDYKVMGSGILQLSDQVIGVVSIFADDANGEEFKEMLRAVNTLKLEPPK
ncbi:MAG: hypothetical protein DME97_12510 [Verrucomicrobia bacterium]|nr:MAG: hypothetical protein DME97_12510 [Verrucomicrobiota bacterium]